MASNVGIPEGFEVEYNPNGIPTGYEVETKKGIDLTPSGLYKQAISYPAGAIRALAKGEDFNTAREKALQTYKDFKPAGGLMDVAFDTAIYSRLPVSKLATADKLSKLGRFSKLGADVANNAITGAGQGAVIGGLEGLKEDASLEGFTKGATTDALVGGSIGGAVPLATPAIKNIGAWTFENSFPALKPKTVRQLIKPNSKALDLDEDTAQNLLMNTTERVQKDYQNLLDNAGREVQYAAMRLPENRGVWTSSLKDGLDDIYNSYQISDNKDLNWAKNSQGDIYDLANDLIGKAKTPERLTASEMYDVMDNIKQNVKIDWDADIAKKRNALKQRVYGLFARKLGNLSPELRKANKEYSKIARFENNEGLRRILYPEAKDTIDSASTALRNYNSTVTKGNTNRNVHNLENLFVRNGKQPFLSDIDDVNAANELLKTAENGLNPFGLTDKLKNIVERPILKAVRGYNKFADNHGLGAIYESIGQEVPRYLIPTTFSGFYNLNEK